MPDQRDVAGHSDVRPPKLLDRVRNAIRTRHYSRRTEEAYVDWINRYIFFHSKTHPAAMGAAEVNAFLTHLAVERNVAASTQAQALSALVFLYRHVLDDPLPWIALRQVSCYRASVVASSTLLPSTKSAGGWVGETNQHGHSKRTDAGNK